MKPIKGLFPIREPNGQPCRKLKRVPSNIGLAPSRRRQKGLTAHTCAVYAIEDAASGYIKIGTARNVAERLETLQLGSTSDLYAFGAYRGLEPLIRRLERLLHKRLKGKPEHVKGEWYRFTPQEAYDTIRSFAKEVGVDLSDDHQYPFGDLTERLAADIVVNDSGLSGVPKLSRFRDEDWYGGAFSG